MNKSDVKVTRYEYGEYYWIDILEFPGSIETWICRGNMSEYVCFGGERKADLASRGESREDFIAKVMADIETYIEWYEEDFPL